jgi:RNA polymerase sigma factor (sigma-70 family)
MQNRSQTLDFADVYQTQLVAVWRYVRSRVSDHHEAQDVTSEVFTRAWRTWGRFDPDRGEVAPWLLRIAQRTVVDWNRRQRRAGSPASIDSSLADIVGIHASEMPDAVLLTSEVLAEVSEALGYLSERERDGIALRFGAGLKMAEVGRVLGLSAGATKMMIARSLTKLSVTLSQRRRTPAVVTAPLRLDDLAAQALRRGELAGPAGRLRDLVLQLAVLHRPELPPELPRRVQFCVDCATGLVHRLWTRRMPADPAPPRPVRPGLLTSTAFSWAPLAPLCVACTIPVLIVPLLAIGMSLDVAYALHGLSLITAPLVFFILWRHFRRHHERIGLWVGGVGAALLIAHLVGHIVIAVGIPPWSVVADQLGTALLLGGALLDAGAMRSWVVRQRQRLASVAAEFQLAPA